MTTSTLNASAARSDSGFTLLELLLVVTILASVAWVSLGMVVDSGERVRFEDTRNRLQAIREAVIGDTSRTLTGRPEIRGYVADMGGLPPNLNALITKDYCSDPQYTTLAECSAASETWIAQGEEHCTDGNYDNQADCETAGEDWMDGDYYYNDNYGFWFGWNGPYLKASELTGYPKFRDGWGNSDETNNFGWNATIGNDLRLQSYGLDGEAGGNAYESDYPPTGSDILVAQNEYRVLVADDGSGGLWVDFGTPQRDEACFDGAGDIVDDIADRHACEDAGHEWLPTATEQQVCLKIAYRDAGRIEEIASTANTLIRDGTSQFLQFEFELEEDTYLGLGQLAYRVFEYNGTSCSSSLTSFPAGATWRPFFVVPGSLIQPLEWEVQ